MIKATDFSENIKKKTHVQVSIPGYNSLSANFK